MSRWYQIKLALTSGLVGAIVASGAWIVFIMSQGAGSTIGLPRRGAPPPPVATRPSAPAITAPSGLVIPVAGIRSDQLVDTYTQARGGGSRPHDAIDIMAPHGTPVVATAGGTVEKLFESKAGGLTVYVRSPDRRFIYYYAHLQSYAPGLAEGQALAKGGAIGTVGSTGNANPAGPHLHFAIHTAQPGEKWYQGVAVNPYPLLAGR